jgi:hypothetical protein
MAQTPKFAFQKLLKSKKVPYQSNAIYTCVNQTCITFYAESETIIFNHPGYNHINFSTPFATPQTIYKKFLRFESILRSVDQLAAKRLHKSFLYSERYPNSADTHYIEPHTIHIDIQRRHRASSRA